MADGIRRNSRDSENEAIRASPALLARLEDRIRTLEGPPQLYGASSIQGQGLPGLAAENRLAIGSRSPLRGRRSRTAGGI